MSVDRHYSGWPGQLIASRDISFVLQGPIDAGSLPTLAKSVANLRQLVPGCEIIVSTWRDALDLTSLGSDHVVRSDDPGALPGIRPSGEYPNSVNRQILSSRAGLQRASRPFAVKMRNDAVVVHPGFVALYEKYNDPDLPEQIVLPAYFTLDPSMFEHVPYHPSDWFHFGATDALRTYWSAPFMTEADATYYTRHPYARHSTYLDRKFLCRLAVEQHVAVAYAQRFALTIPAFHNDIRPQVLADHDRFLSHFLIVGDLDQLGITLPKYDWVKQSGFQDLNCVTHLDWLSLRAGLGHGAPTPQTRARARRKRAMRVLYRTMRPVLPMLYSKRLRGLVNEVLAFGKP